MRNYVCFVKCATLKRGTTTLNTQMEKHQYHAAKTRWHAHAQWIALKASVAGTNLLVAVKTMMRLVMRSLLLIVLTMLALIVMAELM